MLNINGVRIDFDITSPADMLRYKEAGERMEAEATKITHPGLTEDDPGFFDAYINLLNTELRLFGNFMDASFGDGTADQLLGGNPSLIKATEINDALKAAMEEQGKEYGLKIAKYQPNRATRRE
jgi:hypothetical protein